MLLLSCPPLDPWPNLTAKQSSLLTYMGGGHLQTTVERHDKLTHKSVCPGNGPKSALWNASVGEIVGQTQKNCLRPLLLIIKFIDLTIFYRYALREVCL